MTTTRWISAALALGALGCGTEGPTGPSVGLTSGSCNGGFESVADTALAAINRAEGWSAGVLVEVAGTRRCEVFFGAFDRGTTVAVASAAKWLSAATIMAVVDRGLISLDDSVGRFLPGVTGVPATIRLRQLLSHTSGLPAYDNCMFDANLALQTCARTILAGQAIAGPGIGFYYGGASFTVAGAMVEVATGKSWAAVFDTYLAQPLQLAATTYGPGTNPMLSEGGVVTTLGDYGRFLGMLAAGGTSGGGRVLSADAIRELRTPRTTGLPILGSPRGALGYALGSWVDAEAGGLATLSTSPGSRGFVPLIDWNRRIVVIVEAFDYLDRVWPLFQAVWSEVDRKAP
ncbi:MAG: beta-lactamase family protein [Gemmatimonadetes bacterium]|nr:beta-lactamase family protein [Gemmatimonadota bacterium]